jgi:hypothetical protein
MVGGVMRRMFWFVLGVISGVSGVLWVRRKAIAAAEKMTPSAILSVLIDSAKSLVTRLVALYGKSNGVDSAPVPPAPRQP